MPRKKRTKIPQREKVLEFEGLKAGEKIWALTVDMQISQAEILEFYLKDQSGPATSVWTIPDGKYRTVLVKNCFQTKKEAKQRKLDLKAERS